MCRDTISVGWDGVALRLRFQPDARDSPWPVGATTRAATIFSLADGDVPAGCRPIATALPLLRAAPREVDRAVGERSRAHRARVCNRGRARGRTPRHPASRTMDGEARWRQRHIAGAESRPPRQRNALGCPWPPSAADRRRPRSSRSSVAGRELAGRDLTGFAAWVAEQGPCRPRWCLSLVLRPRGGRFRARFAPHAWPGARSSGSPRALLLVFVAATLGSALAFLVASLCGAGPAVEGLDRRQPALLRGGPARSASRAGRIVFLLRLSPAFPFTVLNYALGAHPGALPANTCWPPLGCCRRTLLYVYYGKVAGEVASSASRRPSRRNAALRSTRYWASGWSPRWR